MVYTCLFYYTLLGCFYSAFHAFWSSFITNKDVDDILSNAGITYVGADTNVKPALQPLLHFA